MWLDYTHLGITLVSGVYVDRLHTSRDNPGVWGSITVGWDRPVSILTNAD